MDSLPQNRKELETRILNLQNFRKSLQDKVTKLQSKSNLLSNIATVLLSKVKPTIYLKTDKYYITSVSYSIELDQFRLHVSKDTRFDGTTIIPIELALRSTPPDIKQILENYKKTNYSIYESNLSIRGLTQDIHKLRSDRQFNPVMKAGDIITIDGLQRKLTNYLFDNDTQTIVYNYEGIECIEVIFEGVKLVHNKQLIKYFKG